MIGKKIGGRYRVVHLIGGGGMAKVYRAVDSLTNQTVAIKVLNEQFVADREFVQRFIHEAKACRRLSHSNVVNVFDAGREGNLYYMIMEYVEGLTLKQLIRKKELLSSQEAVNITIQICKGLGHAHDKGIIHRDIKPHNILIARNGRVKVADFGISRILKSAHSITKTGIVMGSVHYFSPEQARGLELRFTSDVYSLGIVLYEMLTGNLPFDGNESIAIALKHIQEHVPDPRKINPGIPFRLWKIIHKSLHKEPHKRYSSTSDMVLDLYLVLRHQNKSMVAAPAATIADENHRSSRLELVQRRNKLYAKEREERDYSIFVWLLALGLLVSMVLFVILSL